MALILLRHTRPEGSEGLCYGRSELALGEDFEDQVNRIARDLPAFRRVLSSPLTRCLRLARVLASTRAVPLTVDERLIEMDFGKWERRPWSTLPRDELDAWAGDLLNARPHGGETVAELSARTCAALTDAGQGAVPALLVTHAGVIKAAIARYEGSVGWDAKIAFGSWRVFDAKVEP
ncbi:histidine phosphatase family protein [Pararhodobacter sp. SW119]|uniref:histidine phosphatase family protein n=1 Tax=Pararhodobacter sp. SW119 TaxID=2780075 RepID=UPI001ADF0F82|nr:histidine phosphatase family protein [Pararhodobacter sp. SW119]